MPEARPVGARHVSVGNTACCRTSLPTVLVLGATGMLGHQAAWVLAGNFVAHATGLDPEAALRYGLPVEIRELDAAGTVGSIACLPTRGQWSYSLHRNVKQLKAPRAPSHRLRSTRSSRIRWRRSARLTARG